MTISRELAAMETSMRSLSREQQREIRDQLLMCREEAEAQARKVAMALESLKMDVQTKENVFNSRVRQMQSAFDREFAVALNLGAMIDSAVDCAVLARSQTRQDELNKQIRALETQISQAVNREEDLKAQMQRAQERLSEMERAAVGQTLQLMAAAVETAHKAEEESKKALADEEGASNKLAKAASTSTGIQTEEASLTPPCPQPETCDTSTQMESDDVVSTSSLVTEVSPLKIAYESQVERLRERDLEIVRSKQELRVAKGHLQVLLDAKGAAKGAIKQ